MAKAARAIIIEDNKLLVMERVKQGSKYYTLIGGRVNENEEIEDGLIREVREETGLKVVNYRLVFYEDHPAPYNEQYIFLTEVAPYDKIALEEASEEALLNKLDYTTHFPAWVDADKFSQISFRTIQLQNAIMSALKSGFPKDPIKI